MSFAESLRRRRLAAGLSLHDLADRSGVSASMLSGVERDEKSPTIRIATQIADGLGCSLTDLLDTPASSNEHLVRRSDAHEFVDPDSGVARRGLSPMLARRGVEPSWYTIPPGARAGPFEHPEGSTLEHLTVVRGRIIVTLGDRQQTLRAGDSLTYRAHVPHTFANPGTTVAQYLHIAVTAG